MRKEKYLIKLRKSRKRYSLYYLMAICVAGVIVYLKISGFKISTTALIVSAVFIAAVIKFTELDRFSDWWGITETSIVESRGLLGKNIRRVGFPSVSDLSLEMPLFKRILNYGDIHVRMFSGEDNMIIKDVNNPEKFLKKIQERVMENREKENE